MKGKNVKRGLATLLLASMAAGTLAGCGQKADTAGSTSADADSDGKTKIVLLLNGYLGDLAWYDCSAAGINAIQEKYGDEVETKVIEMTTDQSKYDSIIEDKGAERQQDRQDVSMGVMRHEEYRAKWYGETVKQAKKNLPEQNQVME